MFIWKRSLAAEFGDSIPVSRMEMDRAAALITEQKMPLKQWHIAWVPA